MNKRPAYFFPLTTAVLLAALLTPAVRPASTASSDLDEKLTQVRTLIAEGKHEDAEAAARALLPEAERRFGAASREVSKVLDELIRALLRQEGKGGLPETLALAERAVAIKEKVFEPEHIDLVLSLNNLAAIHYYAGRDVQAAPLYERSLAIREKHLGLNHPDVARSLFNLAQAYRGLARFAEAVTLYERSLRILEEIRGPDHPDLVSTLTHLGRTLWDMGRYDEAAPHYQRGLAINEETFGPEHPAVAESAAALGVLYYEKGDFSLSRSLLERSLAIREKALGPDHPLVGDSYNDLSVLMVSLGDYVAARGFLDRAVAIWEKAHGPDHTDTAIALTNFGNLLEGMGDYPGVLRSHERALAIFEKALGPAHEYVGLSLLNVGIAHAYLRDYARARPFMERAVGVLEKSLGPDHRDVGEALAKLADTLIHLGDRQQARSYLARAVAINENFAGSRTAQLNSALGTLGYALVLDGDYSGARKTLERAIVLEEAARGSNSPYLVPNLNNLARAMWGLGEAEQAFQVALRAAEISRNHVSLTAQGLPEREALLYATTASSALDLTLTFLTTSLETPSGASRSAWDATLRSRALVLDEMAARHRQTGGSSDPDTLRAAEALQQARAHLARLIVRGPGDQPAERYRLLVDQAYQEKERAERILAGRSQLLREQSTRERAGFREVAGTLSNGTSLVAFVRYQHYDLAKLKVGDKPSQPIPRYLAFVYNSPSTEPVFVPLGPAAAVEDLVQKLRAQIAQEARAPGRAARRNEAAYREVANELRSIIWDPLSPHLKQAAQLFIVPDGALHLVNFAALPAGRSSYLIETAPPIHYLSAERDLVPLDDRPQSRGLLALGGVEFDAQDLLTASSSQNERAGAPLAEWQPAVLARTFRGNRSACGTFQSMQFESLPASGLEAQRIAALWKQHGSPYQTARLRGAAGPVWGDVLYLKGAEASEAAFKEKAPGKRVLHLATHGFFLGSRCPSALESSGDLPSITATPFAAAENPLVLSGVALSGANRRQAAGTDREDGILTAEEIAALDLGGVEWAVLSGCDTGVGEIRAGEGVLGLRRAFQVAGARTLIMSLWPVEDQSAQQWMQRLYRERLVRNQSTKDAVHNASLSILRSRRARGQSAHPFYWASFVAAGNWR